MPGLQSNDVQWHLVSFVQTKIMYFCIVFAITLSTADTTLSINGADSCFWIDQFIFNVLHMIGQ
jgi:hypothetical protein